MVREPVVAGQFYPSNKEYLLRDLNSLIPVSEVQIDAIGAVVPHAGYMCSGDVAGEVYSRLKPKETYIILGPNHTGNGDDFASSKDNWRTPLGEVEVDQELLNSISNSTNLVTESRAAHDCEHSIEVQIPFLQKCAPGSKIVPIAIKYGSIDDLTELAGAISTSIKSSGKDVIVLASSDMTHYKSRREAEKKDNLAIREILDLNPEGLIRVVEENHISMCGYIPSAVMLMAARNLGAKETELVKYSDSGYVTGDIEQVVGYAGIILS